MLTKIKIDQGLRLSESQSVRPTRTAIQYSPGTCTAVPVAMPVPMARTAVPMLVFTVENAAKRWVRESERVRAGRSPAAACGCAWCLVTQCARESGVRATDAGWQPRLGAGIESRSKRRDADRDRATRDAGTMPVSASYLRCVLRACADGGSPRPARVPLLLARTACSVRRGGW